MAARLIRNAQYYRAFKSYYIMAYIKILVSDISDHLTCVH